MAVSDPDTPRLQKVLLIGGDGGFSGVPRHLRHVVRACGNTTDLVVVSDRDRGGYGFLETEPGRHIQIDALATGLSPRGWVAAARALSRLIKQEKPALVWAHSRMGVLLLRALVLAGRFRTDAPRLAVTYHGLPFGPGHHGWAAAISRRIERLALRRGPQQQLVFLSAAARDAFRTTFGADLCARHSLHVQPNCSDLGIVPKLREKQAARHIVMTTRNARQKNLARALRILAYLPGNYRLTLCGAGTDSAEFRRKARRILGAIPLRRVTFAGELADVSPLLAEADLYLLTSLYEGMPVGALEAFEAGLPLALSAIPGTQELRDRHPHAVTLTGGQDPHPENPQEDAIRIIAMTEAFCARRDAMQSEARATWQRDFSFQAWSADMRRLLGRMLPVAEATDPHCHCDAQDRLRQAPLRRRNGASVHQLHLAQSPIEKDPIPGPTLGPQDGARSD